MFFVEFRNKDVTAYTRMSWWCSTKEEAAKFRELYKNEFPDFRFRVVQIERTIIDTVVD